MQTSHIGTSDVIFAYNGRDGVITDDNDLIYMRARYYSPVMRRFINADIIHGTISDSTSLNRYSYVNGNPVSFVDPFGLSAERGNGPTVYEAALMAQHIYDPYNKAEMENPFPLEGDWRFGYILWDNNNGARIGVYFRIVDHETFEMEYAVVNKGSSTPNDWKNNIYQPFGYSEDMRRSIDYVQIFVNEHPNSHITFIGHSKGGGEALANAFATNKDAIVFNPAIPNYNEYGLKGKEYTADATAYVVEGEALSLAYAAILGSAINPCDFEVLYPLLGNAITISSLYIFGSERFWETEPLPNQGDWNPISNHLMAEVIDAVESDPKYH